MADSFFEWLEETINELFIGIADIAKTVVGLVGIIVLFPVWIIPFSYWYFAVWEKREGEEHDGSGSN